MTDYDREIMNQVYYELCSKCSYKYWEACIGIHIEWNVITCKKARERYEQLKKETMNG